MKKALAVIFLFGLSGAAYADSVLEQLSAAGGDQGLQLSAPAAAKAVPAENGSGLKSKIDTMDVDMRIRDIFNDGQRYDIEERAAGIDFNLHKDAENRYAFSGSLDGGYVNGRVEKYGGDIFSISASGINLDMRKYGNKYEISGFVDEKDGSIHIDVDLREEYAGRFSVWENGVNLNISKFGSDFDVSGEIRLGNFGKKSLAMVAVCVGVLDSQKVSQTPQK